MTVVKAHKLRKVCFDTISYIIFLIAFTVVVYPLVWMLYTSFKKQWEIFSNPFSLPTGFYLGNFIEAWTTGSFSTYFLNSILITVPSVLGLVAISSVASYALARYSFRAKKAVLVYFLVGIIIPPQAIVISSYQIMARLGLANTYIALLFTYLSWCSIGIVILRAFFLDLPREIEDAARIDGCSDLAVFLRIAIPLAKPALSTIIIFYFVWIWNDLLYPLIYIQSQDMYTIPLGLMQFRGRYSQNWGLQSAALSIATIPPLLFYMFFQNKFVRGLTAGALKS